MSCGLTSCPDHSAIDDGSASGSSFGFIQVGPEEFTREELQALLKKTRDLLNYDAPIVCDIEREFLECMAEDLDMLDALKAREEADLSGEVRLEIEEHMGSGGAHVTHQWPPCCDDCLNHEILINLVGAETASKWPT